MRANAPQLPGGGWAQLELTDALGERRLTFVADDDCHAFDQKLRLAYPKLEGAGGYTLVRGGLSRELQPLDPPYHVARLKERVEQGKIFIRPLQSDLEVTQEGCLDDEVTFGTCRLISI